MQETDDYDVAALGPVRDEMLRLADDLSLDPGTPAAVPEVIETDTRLQAGKFVGMGQAGIVGCVR